VGHRWSGWPASCRRSGWLDAQALPRSVHQFEGVVDVLAGELAVTLDDVAANDHHLNVGGTRSQDHDGDRVAEPRRGAGIACR